MLDCNGFRWLKYVDVNIVVLIIFLYGVYYWIFFLKLDKDIDERLKKNCY